MIRLLLAAVILLGLAPRSATEPPAAVVPASPTVRSLTPATTPGSLPSSTTGTRAASVGDAPDRASLRGLATWYAADGMVAAAGPALREHLGGDWRGSRVTVCASRCVVVRLSDWCACGPRHGRPTLLDLSDDAFRRLAPLSRGVVAVRVMGAVALPETSTP